MFLDSVMGFFSTDVAMDLGTANTLVWVKGRGIVLNEPSVVAVEKSSNRVLAVGSEAKLMLGRTPDEINAVRPLKDGVIADFQVTEHLLREFVSRVQKHKFLVRPRIIICVPSGITEVEKRAVTTRPCAPAVARCCWSPSRSRPRSAWTCRWTPRPATWSWTSAAAPPRSP